MNSQEGKTKNGGSTVAVYGSKPRRKRAKPPKPYPEFPLYAHAGGVWAKRIRRKEHYFGPWGDPDGALDRYLRERDFLFAGKAPPESGGCTLDELVNRFLVAQEARQASGDISQRQFADYKRDGARILDCLGRQRPAATLQPEDFAKLRAAACGDHNATTATNIIIRQRTIFKWGHDPAKLLPMPLRFGGAFAVPSARLRRRALRINGPKDLSAGDIRTLLAATEGRDRLVNLRAMILLGVNCGLGNTDCSEMEFGNLDLDGGILDYPRPKTEAPRRSMLWPETIAAVRVAIDHRRRMRDVPAALAESIFVTIKRNAYVHMSPKGHLVDVVSMEFAALARRCKVHRKGVGFYALRHTCQTVADATRDFPAIDLVMGHVPDDGGGAAPFSVKMSARYRERIGNDRLAAVSSHVRAWLFDNGQ